MVANDLRSWVLCAVVMMYDTSSNSQSLAADKNEGSSTGMLKINTLASKGNRDVAHCSVWQVNKRGTMGGRRKRTTKGKRKQGKSNLTCVCVASACRGDGGC